MEERRRSAGNVLVNPSVDGDGMYRIVLRSIVPRRDSPSRFFVRRNESRSRPGVVLSKRSSARVTGLN